MYKRKGSRDAALLFASEDIDVWRSMMRGYDAAIVQASTTKRNPQDLIDCDRWWRNDYPSIVEARPDMYISRDELSKVMQWKLLRGVHRPALQNLIMQNSEESVISTSRSAFSILREDASAWQKAMAELSSLRGVGVATASAILAPLFPEHCPFMADEVVEGSASASGDVVGKIDYSARRYSAMRSVLVAKAKHLNVKENEEEEKSWTAEMVGRAMWAASVLEHRVDTELLSDDSSKRIADSGSVSVKRRKTDT